MFLTMKSRIRRDSEIVVQGPQFLQRSRRGNGAIGVCQGTHYELTPRYLRRGGWLLLFALPTLLSIASAASAYDLAAGSGHTCVIDDNGVTCWGKDQDGKSTVPAGLINPTVIAAGSYHTCAIDYNGVTCWGSNDDLQSTVPAGLINPRAITAGYCHTCAVDDNGVTCWGANGDGQSTVPEDLIFNNMLEVEIYIKPGSEPNPINPLSRAVVPVAILGSDTFDVTDVDVTTLAFGPDGAPPALDLANPFVFWLSHRDVNGDGENDLLSYFQTENTGIAMGDAEACLTGKTLEGTPIEGCDAIVTAPGCGHGFE